MAGIDDYLEKRKNEAMGTPTATATPQTVAPTLEAQPQPDPAKSYIDRLTSTLSGKDATVQNARATANTSNAVGNYLAKREGQQQSLNAGYSPGTLQSQRTMDRYQAGANETALARDNQVNQLARDRTDTAMSQANQLRQEGVQQTERLRQEGLSEIETLIKSVNDPVTQAYLRRIQAAGGDVKAAIAGNLGTAPGADAGGNSTPTNPTNPVGSVDPSTGLPISDTPAQLALKSAQDWVKALRPDLDPDSPEFAELVNARVGGADEAQMRTITEANKKSKLTDAQNAAKSNFASLTPEQQTLLAENTQEFSPLEIPVGTGIFDAFKQTNPIVKIGGKLYKPVDTIEWKQGKNRDFSVFQAPDGSYLYVDKSGKTTTQPIHQGTDTASRTRWLESFK